jgi:hypothetical protein
MPVSMIDVGSADELLDLRASGTPVAAINLHLRSWLPTGPSCRKRGRVRFVPVLKSLCTHRLRSMRVAGSLRLLDRPDMRNREEEGR